MREVARAARVSTSTVSLALRNSRLVAEETRTRIVAIAEKLQYRMHPYTAAHMRSRRNPRMAVSKPVLALIDTSGTTMVGEMAA